MNENPIAQKTEDFAVRIINLWKFLIKNHEYEMSGQVKRSGTSIGANVVEGLFAQSKKDFLSKFHIALKENAETQYWLRLLHRSEYLTDEQYKSLITDAEEIGKILSKIIITTKKSLNKDSDEKINFEIDETI